MARFNEIQVGRYNRFIQKLLQIKGPPSMAQVATEMQPVFQFFNGAENRYLEGWLRYGQAASVPAGGAGTFFMVRLRNPATSNVIAVVEKIVVYNLGAATDTVTLNHGAVATDLATVNTGISRFDGRGNQTGALIFSSTAAAIASFGGNKENFQLLTNARVELIATDIQEIPIVPGDAIQVQGSVANLNVNGASFWWRERFIEEAERT